MVVAIPAVYDPVDMARRRRPYNRSEPIPGTLGFYVRYRREVELGISQQELADRIVDLGGKMTQGDISELELGESLPRPNRMRLLAQALEVPLGKLYAEAGHPDHAALGSEAHEPSIELLPLGNDGEIVALFRRIPAHRRPHAVEYLRILAGQDEPPAS